MVKSSVKASFSMDISQVMAGSSEKKCIMLETTKKEIVTVTEQWFGLMAKPMKVPGKMTKCMVQAN